MNDKEASALLALVSKRVTDLLIVRKLYRQNHWSAEWSELRKSQEAELRSLLTLARAARKAARAEALDDVTAAKGYHEAYPAGVGYHDVQSGRLSEDELIGAYDADSGFRESQPEFNGAFR